jgi:site-specific DNA recombinase
LKQYPQEMPMRKRAVIYCRVSTDKQEQDGESLEYQEDKCSQYADLHDIEVILVLKEAKSGFIHYSYREQLTLARQFIRDRMADVIIVWDLRRFSRNFVHSAMIFEEIESVGAEIVSVSENIDNSLTGKLIRSILAWSAESEREKIVEYANRHWQTRWEHNLPMGTGRSPYGWQWGDKDKTFYVVNPEEAAVRFSIFHMFAVLCMSIRAIAHKLTEDGILPPGAARGRKVKSTAWLPSTIHFMLRDEANIGVLRILKSKKALTTKGTETRKPNELTKTIVDGLPPIIPVEMYELAQVKLKNNKSELSHLHRNPEDFLLRGHVFCKTCGYRMLGRYRRSKRVHIYPYYGCANHQNKYNACADLPQIRTGQIDDIVWEDCCRVFERLELIRDTIEQSIEQSVHDMLEESRGKIQMEGLQEEIAYARQERDKHPEGSYYYRLISQDVREKEEKLRRYEEEYRASADVVKLSNMYQKTILGFLDFLASMQDKYHTASFKEKRNALDVLGVKVYVCPNTPEERDITEVDSELEWLRINEAVEAGGISESVLYHHINAGHIEIHKRPVPQTVFHRDELIRFLAVKRRNQTREITLDAYEEEWFTITQLQERRISTWRTIRLAMDKGELKAETRDVPHSFIHRDELNRFLRENPVRSRSDRDDIGRRIEISYTPIFTGVQSSFG